MRRPFDITSSSRRRFVRSCLCALALLHPALRHRKPGQFPDDDLVIVDGWVLRRSDLADTR